MAWRILKKTWRIIDTTAEILTYTIVAIVLYVLLMYGLYYLFMTFPGR